MNATLLIIYPTLEAWFISIYSPCYMRLECNLCLWILYEINRIQKGKHYGFPYLCMRCNPYYPKHYDELVSIPLSYSIYESDPDPLHDLLEREYNDASEALREGRDNPADFVAALEKPLFTWHLIEKFDVNNNQVGSAAPSGIAHYPYSGLYANSLLVSLLAFRTGGSLERFVIQEDGSLERMPSILDTHNQRIRDVFVRDAKTIYILTGESQFMKLILAE